MDKHIGLGDSLKEPTTADKFKFVLPLSLPGFESVSESYGGLAFRSHSDEAFDVQYERFRERLLAAIGREYLPIYRLADGEFSFMVGQRQLTRGALSMTRHAAHRLRIRIYGGSHRTCWGEEYSAEELDRAKDIFLRSLRKVAGHGIIAVYFSVRVDGWGEAYFEPICGWLDANGIALGRRNYAPFYFVYAALNGPRRGELYEGRRILVVTHLTPERKAAIERALLVEGAAAVVFLPVSANKALLDAIDLTAVEGSIDLALVAAGIGSVSILAQLEPLGIPSIDCGMSLECLLDGSRRSERPFLIGNDRK